MTKTAVVTISATNYFGRAATLMESLHNWHPSWDRFMVWTDCAGSGAPKLPSDVHNISVEDLEIGEARVEVMSSIYDVTEFSTSLKPFAMKYLHNCGYDRVIYMDPDTLVMRQMIEITQGLEDYDIVLTPHILEPMPEDGYEPSGDSIRAAGSYNLGFIATTIDAYSLLDWWGEQLVLGAVNRPAENLFTDQRWMDQIPGYAKTLILRNPGYNVAYWNLHERSLRTAISGLEVNETPLTFFHFSGFSTDNPWLLSKHARKPRVTTANNVELLDLCLQYAKRVNHFDSIFKTQVWTRGTTNLSIANDLVPRWLQVALARRLRAEVVSGELIIPSGDAKSPGGSTFFSEWLSKPANGNESSGLSRLAWIVWSERADLQSAFPDIRNVDRENYLEWLSQQGPKELGSIAEKYLQGQRRNASVRHVYAIGSSDENLVVNIVGYFDHSSGVGEVARSLSRVLTLIGWKVSNIYLEPEAGSRGCNTNEYFHGAPTIWCVNADRVNEAIGLNENLHRESAINIGYWFWECENCPEYFTTAASFFEKIWCSTTFIENALEKKIGKSKVTKIPTYFDFDFALENLENQDLVSWREHLQISKQSFVFLSRFDFRSVYERKNPKALIEAYKDAFDENSGVTLLIKTNHGREFPEQLQELAWLTHDRGDIYVVDFDMERIEGWKLLSECNAFVSLHRSEGLGLNIAEAMYLGKPVVVSRYSGNMDFCTENNSLLVDGRLTTIPLTNAGPYSGLGAWFDPDLESAKRALKLASRNDSNSNSIGVQAHVDMTEFSNLSKVTDFFQNELKIAAEEERELQGVSNVGTVIENIDIVRLETLSPSDFQLDSVEVAFNSGSVVGLRGWIRRALFKFNEMTMWYQRRIAEQILDELHRTMSTQIRIEVQYALNQPQTNGEKFTNNRIEIV